MLHTRARPMIVLDNVTKRFGPKILFENVSLQFDPGKRYGVTGANGAGKSTLMEMLSGPGRVGRRAASTIPGSLRLGVPRAEPLRLRRAAHPRHRHGRQGRAVGRDGREGEAARRRGRRRRRPAPGRARGDHRRARRLLGRERGGRAAGRPRHPHREARSSPCAPRTAATSCASSRQGALRPARRDAPRRAHRPPGPRVASTGSSASWSTSSRGRSSSSRTTGTSSTRWRRTSPTSTTGPSPSTRATTPSSWPPSTRTSSGPTRWRRTPRRRSASCRTSCSASARTPPRASRRRAASSRSRSSRRWSRPRAPSARASCGRTCASTWPSPAGATSLRVDGARKAFGDKVVLDGVNLHVNRGDRIAVHRAAAASASRRCSSCCVGAYKDLDDETKPYALAPDAGEVRWGNDASVGYFAQDHHEALDRTAQGHDALRVALPLRHAPPAGGDPRHPRAPALQRRGGPQADRGPLGRRGRAPAARQDGPRAVTTCSCSTSPPTTSTSSRSRGCSRACSSSRARCSSSATTTTSWPRLATRIVELHRPRRRRRGRGLRGRRVQRRPTRSSSSASGERASA